VGGYGEEKGHGGGRAVVKKRSNEGAKSNGPQRNTGKGLANLGGADLVRCKKESDTVSQGEENRASQAPCKGGKILIPGNL